MQKYRSLALLFGLISIFLLPLRTQAQEDQITENLKKRLQESLTASPTPPTNLLRGYVGTVKDMISNTLVVEYKDGRIDIKLTDDTTIVRSPGNALVKATNINIGDSIIAIGTITSSDETLQGKRLVVSTNPILPPSKTTGLGVIKKIDKSTLTLTLPDTELKLKLTSKTILKTPAGPIELSDLEIGDTVIYTATVSDDSQLATIIMRIKTSSLSDTAI